MDPRYVLISRDTVDDIKAMAARALKKCQDAQPYDFSKPLALEDDSFITYPEASGYSLGTLKSVIECLDIAVAISEAEEAKMLHEVEEEQRQTSTQVSDIFAVSVWVIAGAANVAPLLCPGGGIGRRTRLKICWLFGRASSSLARGTSNKYLLL